MLPHEFNQIIPNLPEQADVLESYQLTRDFYREVQYRQELDNYCQWYYEAARQHREELDKMRRDINIFGWFRRGG